MRQAAHPERGYNVGEGWHMARPGRWYTRRVSKGLERALDHAVRLSVDIRDSNERWVIFSDHHKGQRDRADAFTAAEQAYHAALGYYFEHGYKLVVLGDVEELWENRVGPILETYRTTFELERDFYDQDRYFRVWGNHDDDWRYPSQVERHLDQHYPGIQVEECYLLDVFDGGDRLGQIMLVHGHQGTLIADTFGWLTRILVRTIWRPIQRITNLRVHTPATDLNLRRRHGIAMYNWASARPAFLLVAGHTHHPIFDPVLQVEQQMERLDRARGSMDTQRIARARARLEHLKVLENRQGFKMSRPSYFNTGCCCFADGDITGIELDRGTIKLVRWSDNLYQPDVRASAELVSVFQRVSSARGEAKPLVNQH